MNCSSAWIFEVNEMGSNELTWCDLIVLKFLMYTLITSQKTLFYKSSSRRLSYGIDFKKYCVIFVGF